MILTQRYTIFLDSCTTEQVKHVTPNSTQRLSALHDNYQSNEARRSCYAKPRGNITDCF